MTSVSELIGVTLVNSEMVEHVLYMGWEYGVRNAKFQSENLKEGLERRRPRCEDDIKMDLKEIRCEDVD